LLDSSWGCRDNCNHCLRALVQEGIAEERQPKSAQYQRTAQNHCEYITPAR
jgi:hypothetical protein